MVAISGIINIFVFLLPKFCYAVALPPIVKCQKKLTTVTLSVTNFLELVRDFRFITNIKIVDYHRCDSKYLFWLERKIPNRSLYVLYKNTQNYVNYSENKPFLMKGGTYLLKNFYNIHHNKHNKKNISTNNNFTKLNWT